MRGIFFVSLLNFSVHIVKTKEGACKQNRVSLCNLSVLHIVSRQNSPQF